MPKYIERDKLPQFQYYNFCDGEDLAWETDKEEGMWARLKEKTVELKDPSLIQILDKDILTIIEPKSEAEMRDTLARWFKRPGKVEESIKKLCGAYMEAFIKDDHTKLKWEKRYIRNVAGIDQSRYEPDDETEELDDREKLAYIHEIVLTASHLRVCQGFPLSVSDDEEYVPKLLLIKDKIYNSLRKNTELELDYDIIRKGLETEVAIIAINGDSPEKKMVFELNIMKDKKDIYINMFDPNNGLSSFRLVKNVRQDSDLYNYFQKRGKPLKPDETILYCSRWICHPRGSWLCRENPNDAVCIYGRGECSCTKRSLNIAAAVLYCYQEYLKTNDTEYVKPEKQNALSSDKKPAQPFIPPGMMRLYDVKLSEEEKIKFNKFSLFGGKKSQYTSTEKCPHARRGTMRYNPKTGQKDIKVRGSIIHKDRYEGFASAERITE